MQSSVTDIIGVALSKWINALLWLPLCQVTAFKEESQTLKVLLLFFSLLWKIKLITLIKYSVMLSGLLGLWNVKNISISLPELCTDFVMICTSSVRETNTYTHQGHNPGSKCVRNSPPAEFKPQMTPAISLILINRSLSSNKTCICDMT